MVYTTHKFLVVCYHITLG